MLGICSSSMLVLHETLLVPVLMCGSETTLRREEKEILRVGAVQMDNLCAGSHSWVGCRRVGLIL